MAEQWAWYCRHNSWRVSGHEMMDGIHSLSGCFWSQSTPSIWLKCTWPSTSCGIKTCCLSKRGYRTTSYVSLDPCWLYCCSLTNWETILSNQNVGKFSLRRHSDSLLARELSKYWSQLGTFPNIEACSYKWFERVYAALHFGPRVTFTPSSSNKLCLSFLPHLMATEGISTSKKSEIMKLCSWNPLFWRTYALCSHQMG